MTKKAMKPVHPDPGIGDRRFTAIVGAGAPARGMMATPDSSRSGGIARITVERDAWGRLVVVRRRSREPVEFRLLLLREWFAWKLFGRVPAFEKGSRPRETPRSPAFH